MDREEAKKFLEVSMGRNYIGKTPNGKHLFFCRADEKEIESIEKLSDKELLEEWHDMVYMIDVASCFSVMDLQVERLLDMEIHSRNLDDKAEEIYTKLTANRGGLND
jgi:hypothetical protein